MSDQVAMPEESESEAEEVARAVTDAVVALDPREAQDKISEAFGPADDNAAPDDAPLDDDEALEEQSGAASSAVVHLHEDDAAAGTDTPMADNPFAREMAEGLAIRKLEALLFASPKPLSEAVMAERLPDVDLPPLLERLQRLYENRGINLRVINGNWQFVTSPDVADVLVAQRTQSRKLTRAALETLAIIAYHQPCSRADIEEVRGVAVAKGSLDQLMEMGWIRLRGRRDAPGRPVLYGTTASFLEHFGLSASSDLPGMADLKAAGLLDARLPPGFTVPAPRDAEDDEAAPADALAEDSPEFTADFHSDAGEGDAEAGEAGAGHDSTEL